MENALKPLIFFFFASFKKEEWRLEKKKVEMGGNSKKKRSERGRSHFDAKGSNYSVSFRMERHRQRWEELMQTSSCLPVCLSACLWAPRLLISLRPSLWPFLGQQVSFVPRGARSSRFLLVAFLRAVYIPSIDSSTSDRCQSFWSMIMNGFTVWVEHGLLNHKSDGKSIAKSSHINFWHHSITHLCTLLSVIKWMCSSNSVMNYVGRGAGYHHEMVYYGV